MWNLEYLRHLVGLSLAVGLALRAEEPVRDVPRLTRPPVIDGIVDDEVWREALPVDDFVARLPVDGARPSLRTEVRIGYTQQALFIALRAFDSHPDSIRATSMRRDDFAITGGDQFVVAIDTFRDRRNGYWFSTNSLGARVDAQFSDEGQRFDDAWNGAWEAAARIDPLGWSAEIAIPWATLRFPETPDVVMGINLFRRIPRTNEQIFAPAIPLLFAQGTPNVSAARPYRFKGLRSGAHLDFRPFALATTDRQVGEWRSDHIGGGFFARLPVSSAVTLSGTWKADFSEAEADENQLNLTRFPLFLPEKRDFFLEGAGLFAFGLPGEAELFFSRTIGLAPGRDGKVSTVPITWGMKAIGRTGPVEFGALSASTAAAPAQGGEHFDATRARFILGDRSTVGTFWSRRGTSAEARSTAGVDFSHFLAEETRLQGFAARSAGVEGEEGRAWFLGLSRSGERTSFTLSALDLAPGFNPAMGLVARPGTRRLEASGTLPWFPGNTSPVRRFAPGLSFVRYDDHGGRGFEERVGISFATAWKNDCRSRGELTRQREHLAAPFRIYRDIVVEPGDYARWEWAASGATDPTRELSAEAELRMGGLFGGNHRAAGLALSWQPNRFLVVSSAWTGDHVELPQARFLAWVARARIGLTASPRLRLDLLGQYESERRGTGIGFRFRFDFREGTQLLLAWDSVEIRRPLGSPVLHGERVQRGAIRGSYLLLF